MMPAVLQARGKVNLGLRITGVRADGYHELDSLFWPLAAPCDVLHLAAGQAGGLHMTCTDADIDPTHNTLTKAYALFGEASGFRPALRLHLEKHIPHGAGLGGGSSDAASLLRWLNSQAPHPLPPEALAALGLRVGADVPFFLHNQPCRVRGIGEIITPSPENTLAGCWLLLLCPPVYVSTPWAYQAWDALPVTEKAQNNLTTRAVEGRETNSCEGWLSNDFEAAVFPCYPVLAQLKRQLLDCGASAAVMSGSGSSMVGIFQYAATAERAFSQCAESVRIRFLQQL